MSVRAAGAVLELDTPTADGRTPLDVAAQAEKWEVCSALLDAGAKRGAAGIAGAFEHCAETVAKVRTAGVVLISATLSLATTELMIDSTRSAGGWAAAMQNAP